MDPRWESAASHDLLAPQVAAWGDREQQLAVDLVVDSEVHCALQEFADRGCRVVPATPGPVGIEVSRHRLDHRVHHHEVTARRHQRRIELQLPQDVVMGVVGIEHHHHGGVTFAVAADLFEHRWIGGGALDHRDSRGERVALDLRSILRPNLDVDAHDTPIAAEHMQQRSPEHQRPPMGDAGLDDQVGLHAPDDFLDRDDVIGKLDDRPAEPAEVIGVAIAAHPDKEVERIATKGGIGLHPVDSLGVDRHQATFRNVRAGLPTTVAPSGTSRMTTAPAPTVTSRPILTRGKTTAPAPMSERSPTSTQPASVAPGAMWTPWPSRHSWSTLALVLTMVCMPSCVSAPTEALARTWQPGASRALAATKAF